jgi:fructokinase
MSDVEKSYLKTPQVNVVDTVGAGDAFTAAFCSAYMFGKSLQEAHRLAVEISAYVCTQHGAMPVLPDELKNSFK